MYTPREDSFLLLEVVKKQRLKDKLVLDMGTGTGIIAEEALKKGARVEAVDIDKEAIEYVKRKNRNNPRIKVYLSDLFSNVNGRYDYIFFNAPYLPMGKGQTLADRGGKHGYELLTRFINELNRYLKEKGKAFIVYSSLTKKERIIEASHNNLLNHEIVKKKRIFFEEIYVVKLERNKLNKDLSKKGIDISGLLGKGKHSKVYRGIKRKDKKEVAIKVFKQRFNYKKEKEILLYLNKTNSFFTPQILNWSDRYCYIVEEKVDGISLKEARSMNKNIIIPLKLFFIAARQLDIRGIKKEEMNHPEKHLWISKDHFFMIDYERGFLKKNPNNVGEAATYIMNILNTLRNDKGRVIELLKKYKKGTESIREKTFWEIYKLLFNSGISDIFEILGEYIFGKKKEIYKKIYFAIPKKELSSYGEIGKKLGMHPRKVGYFLKKNPILITIPCHMVIPSSSYRKWKEYLKKEGLEKGMKVMNSRFYAGKYIIKGKKLGLIKEFLNL